MTTIVLVMFDQSEKLWEFFQTLERICGRRIYPLGIRINASFEHGC
jgi:hypothetical protein